MLIPFFVFDPHNSTLWKSPTPVTALCLCFWKCTRFKTLLTKHLMTFWIRANPMSGSRSGLIKLLMMKDMGALGGECEGCMSGWEQLCVGWPAMTFLILTLTQSCKFEFFTCHCTAVSCCFLTVRKCYKRVIWYKPLIKISDIQSQEQRMRVLWETGRPSVISEDWL